jgi:hypothetical protein
VAAAAEAPHLVGVAAAATAAAQVPLLLPPQKRR